MNVQDILNQEDNMKKRFIGFLSLALALVMLLASCGAEKNIYMGVSDYIINSDDVLRLNSVTPQESLDALKVGDSVTIGRYDLNNTDDGDEDIKWTVLAIENGKALIISDLCIDARIYNEGKESVTWESSDVRAWLNGSFYANSFDETEKGYILLSDIDAEGSAAHDVDGGNDTQDNIFLLSFNEAEAYFETDEARIAKASAKAVANGGQCFDSRTKSEAASAPELADDHMALTWWLRTPGSSDEQAATVLYFGKPDTVGARADLATKGVRPAMWIRTVNEVLPEKVYTTDDWATLMVGDKVSFGTYEQNGDTTEADSLIWKVLAIENGNATLITEKIVDTVLYYDFEYSTDKTAGSTAWNTSHLRSWLNSEFKNSFNEVELGYIVESTLKNPAHDLTGIGGCEDTADLIYVLSSEELETLIPSVLDRKAEPTDTAIAHGAYVDPQSGCADWWLRDSGEAANLAKTVLYYGGIDDSGKLVKCDYVGVRPVITVDITK